MRNWFTVAELKEVQVTFNFQFIQKQLQSGGSITLTLKVEKKYLFPHSYSINTLDR